MSVNKGGCGHQAIALQPPRPGHPEGSQDGHRMPPTIQQSTAAATPMVHLEETQDEKTGFWPQIEQALIKGMIAVSPDSCIFPHLEKC